MEKKRPSILAVNYLYLFCAILFVTIGSFFQERNINSGIFITEYIIILLPVILLATFKKYDFKEVFRLNKITFKEIRLTIFIVIASYPIGIFLNYIMIIVISKFGEPLQSPLPVPEDIIEFAKFFFLFAISPGICEEFMFRGLIQPAYERIGTKRAILITGLLFGVFHLNIQNFIGPTVLGILFGYMVYKTNSLYTGIIAHITNNGIALILLTAIGNQEAEMLPPDILLAGLISLIIPAIISSIIVYFLLKSLVKVSKSRVDFNFKFEETSREKVGTLQKILEIIPIVIVIIIFIIFVFAYFNHIMN